MRVRLARIVSTIAIVLAPGNEAEDGLLQVREIADLMAFLASDRSGYTSGAIFTVDGGIASRASII